MSLQAEVRPGAGIAAYSIYVDGVPAAMESNHRGQALCAGRCGDGSSHALLYSFSGRPGAAIAIILRCAGRTVCAVRAEIVGEAGGHSRAGREVFAL